MITFRLDFRPDPSYPRRVPEMHTDLYEQDMMRYDHIAQWNRPVWRAVPRMPTHKCKPTCAVCLLWQMGNEQPTLKRINALKIYANKLRGYTS
jgi:hypothetical protein